MPKLNRFEWLKAVLQCADLNSSTKAVASALSVQFTNDKTGQLNPSLNTLGEFLAGMSLATIKRCLKQLIECGRLFRTEGRGAGNHTEYALLTRCKIIPFRRKKGTPVSFPI
ncbi:helix-turn-helix domain-containing protein [Epibacterium ulvae]|uniref:helix-turn-helix domain-containing protein n=1 Tax=Epibacterium ulvae TaxID=1156985 RepID=UPI001BFC1C9E|nr:helix-turn-helix domain-containing protein [Epibacterium ulvae]MBT8153799.1 helix-turn-helix domain-containing protein [Epibacterium ulvae]